MRVAKTQEPAGLGLTELSGLVLIDKESGPTSHDLVDMVRRLAGQRSVGHTGALDPMATGLMGILLGRATKLEPWLVRLEKRYMAEIVLGLSTDTCDVTGGELSRHPGPWPEKAAIETALFLMTGEVMQTPPAYSAIKVGGQTAHKAARAGRPLELAPRKVKALELFLVEWKAPVATISARVSTGYYVRSLARDLGVMLGLSGGALSALRRLSVGEFDLSMAAPMPASRDALKERLISPRGALSHLPEITVGPLEARRLSSGNPVPHPLPELGIPGPGPYKIIGPGGALLALAECSAPDGMGDETSLKTPRRPFLRPLRVLEPIDGSSPHDRSGE